MGLRLNKLVASLSAGKLPVRDVGWKDAAKCLNCIRGAGAGLRQSGRDKDAQEQSGAVRCNIRRAEGDEEGCLGVQLLRLRRW